MTESDDLQLRWGAFHAAVMGLAKKSGFDGCVVAAFSLVRLDETLGGRLFSATASNPDVEPDVILGIHTALAQRLVGLTSDDLNGLRPVAEA